MKLGVLIPDRGDRPRFMENCLRMLKAQTMQPDIVEVVKDLPTNGERDITKRYRMGYDRLRGKNLEIIALMENDDYYSPRYLETMVHAWQSHNRPNIFGTNYTIYYHIKLFAQFTMNHNTRSSAMSTLIRPDLRFPWCPDNEPFTDIHLWRVVKGITFRPNSHICLGIKHGEGLCGGGAHTDKLERYTTLKTGLPDPDKKFLRSVLDEESYNFYSNYYAAV
jgi:hypothetical protein